MSPIVGRLTRSLPLSRLRGLPVHVARALRAAPFCELRKHSELTETPYSSAAFIASIGGSRSNQKENESAP